MQIYNLKKCKITNLEILYDLRFLQDAEQSNFVPQSIFNSLIANLAEKKIRQTILPDFFMIVLRNIT